MLKITLVAMGTKMPTWIAEGTNEYARRLKEQFQLKLIDIPLLKRGKTSDLSRILEKENAQILSALPEDAILIALDIHGKSYNSLGLAKKLNQWQLENSHLCFIIGGPEGLGNTVFNKCHEKLSLSSLTLPHPLVRVILLEALYRAWAINHHHPYHK